MDPENGSNMGAIDPSPPTDTTQTTTDSTTLSADTAAPQTDTTTQTDTSVDNATPAGRVQDILNAFNKELNNPSQAAPAKPAAPPADPIHATPDQVARRSYDGLDEEEVRIFKRMHNDVYNKMYPAYQEYKTLKSENAKMAEDLKKLQGQSYFDHENAYQLQPEYHQLTSTISRIEQEGQFWEQQLAAVEAGEKWYDLTYDPQSGKYTPSQPLDPSPQAKAALINKITRCHSMNGQLQNELGQFQNSFKTQHQNYVNSLASTRDRVLEGVDPAMKKALEQAAVSKLELWPLGMRQRPEVKIAAELMVINDGLLKLLIEKESQLAGKTIVNRTAQNAGPVNVGGSGPANGNTVESAMDAFHRAGFRH